MGLPMYREPSPTGSKPSTLKADASAQARSSIRRQQDVVRHQAIRQQAMLRQRLANQPSAPRISVTRYEPDELPPIIDRDAQSSRRQTRSPDFALLDLRPGSSSLSDSARREAGHRLLRDALRHGQPGRRMRVPRESTLRFEYASPWSEAAALTSPRSGPGRESENNANDRSPDNDQSLPFTPGFAPAWPFYDRPPFSLRDEVSSLAHHQVDGGLSPNGDELHTQEAPNRRTRSLRRVGRRSVNDLAIDGPIRSRSTIDGLGDRQRSFSPDEDANDDDHEHDPWETLLTTITPDATLPSADSSFTSTAASASASNNAGRGSSSSNSSSSQRSSNSTALTQPSSRASPVNASGNMIFDPYPEYLHPCDIPMLASDDDTEPESDADRRFTSSVSSLRPRRAHLFDDDSGLRGSYRYPSRRHQIDSAAEVGSLQDSQPPLPSTLTPAVASPQESIDADLQQMQSILNFLARRDDIPEEWWQQVGLSRTGRSSSGGATPRLN